eukprot:758449-Hanusia_phi.AAC.3
MVRKHRPTVFTLLPVPHRFSPPTRPFALLPSCDLGSSRDMSVSRKPPPTLLASRFDLLLPAALSFGLGATLTSKDADVTALAPFPMLGSKALAWRTRGEELVKELTGTGPDTLCKLCMSDRQMLLASCVYRMVAPGVEHRMVTCPEGMRVPPAGWRDGAETRS